MSSELVSVIIPAYNHERYVEASIRGVMAQEHENIECIIINDGSRDRTAEVIRSLEPECRQRFSRFEFIDRANAGVAMALNQGVDWSRSEFVSSIASDDIMKPCKLGRLLAALQERPEKTAMAFGDADYIDDDGHFVALDAAGAYLAVDDPDGYATFLAFYLRNRPDVDLEHPFDYLRLLRGNFIPAMSTMWRRSALVRVGKFTPGIAVEDWDLWLRLAHEYDAVHVPEVVASYRWHKGNSVKTAATSQSETIDRVLMRERSYAQRDPACARQVAQTLLQNALNLVRAGRYYYLLRLFNIRLRLEARRSLN
jgi:alpha-1,3-rhamnosyltransferase